MKNLLIFTTAIIFLTGCAAFRPSVTAGVYINNEKGAKPTINSGNSNSQIVPINEPMNINLPATEEGETQDAIATTTERKANASGIFVNANVGDRSAATDITSAIELLDNVRGTSAGQSQTTSKGDSSPTTGTQTQQADQHEEKPIEIPVSVTP